MEITVVLKALTLPACMVFLIACSNSDGVFTAVEIDATDTTDTTTGTSDSGSTDAIAGTDDSGNTDASTGTNDSGSTNAATSADDSGSTQVSAPVVPIELQAEGSNVGLSSELPEFVTSACGTLPVSAAVQSTNRSEPTTMTTSQLVSGSIDPGSATNGEHSWRIALEPGHYHLVLDSERSDKQISNLGIELKDLNSFDTNDGVLLVDGRQTNNRARFHAYFEVIEARTMNLLIKPNWDPEDYTFGIFKNGNAVPSPYFVECPTINFLDIDTDTGVSFILPQKNTSAEDRWFVTELKAGSYLRFTKAVRTDGEADNNQFGVYYVDQFGQSKRFMGFEAGVDRSEPGPIWLRIQNFGNELSVELALFSLFID